LLRLSLPPPTGRVRPVGLFPAGAFGSLDRLGEPAAGSGALLALLARHGVPVLPAGVWHEQGSLHAGFGPCILPADRGSAAEQVMQVIAELLPPKMRGRFQTASAPALSARRGVKALTEPAKPAALEQT
ncbi:MAG: hypothetical protein ACR2PL_00390, partial [Dehalococcoidia bacterium]